MNSRNVFRALVMSSLLMGACAHYKVADSIKMVSFEDDVHKGRSLGPVRGEDCVWSIGGYKLGGNPTLDRAMANARSQSGGGVVDSFKSNSAKAGAVRYMNSVSTENDGFNAVIVGKECLVVKGLGYL